MKILLLFIILVSSNSICANSSKTRITHVQLKVLEKKILELAVKRGRLPASKKELLSFLWKDGDFMAETMNSDSWGQQVIYNFPSINKERLFDLYSMGPNLVDDGGSNDDIVVWETRDYYKYSGYNLVSFVLFILLLDLPILIIIYVVWEVVVKKFRLQYDKK